MSVSSLCLGTAQLGMAYGVAGSGELPSARAARSVLSAAAELGIGALDTAPAYGDAELRIGNFLAAPGRAGAFEIYTKLPSMRAVPAPGIRAYVGRCLQESLRRLQMDHVDVYLIHDIADLRAHGSALVDALCEQRDAGRVGRLGVSVYAPADLSFVVDHSALTVVQHPFSLLDQRLMQPSTNLALRETGIAVHVRSVLLQGLLTMDPDALPAHLQHARVHVSNLRRTLADHGRTVIDSALPFVLGLGAERVVIGADSADQLAGIVATSADRLAADLVARLEHEFARIPTAVIDPRTWTAP